jgi:hypothetical protein
MNATVHAIERSPGFRPASPSRPTRTPAARAVPEAGAWLVDVGALALARALFAGHAPNTSVRPFEQQALLEVPPAYEQFCRSHFTSVRRLHPELSWDDACPAYAVALSAHAALCDELDAGRESQLAAHWDRIRGASRLEWPQAASLVADGCSALARLDPLAMRR